MVTHASQYQGIILKQYDGLFNKTVNALKTYGAKFEKTKETTVDMEAVATVRDPLDIVEDDDQLSGAERLLKRRRLETPAAYEANSCSQTEKEINKYLNLDIETASDNPLTFWAESKDDFVILSQCVREIFCIPASSSCSERVFSVGTKVKNFK